MLILKPKIIGIALFLGLLFTQAPMAHALYSPVLSKEAGEIKQDIMKSRQQNGVGSWLNAWDKVNQENVEYKRKGMATGTPGMFSLMGSAVSEIAIQSASESFVSGFSMLFPWLRSKTSCLRDDIWELQALQEEVLNEMFKASLLSDIANGGALLEDYKFLQARIDGETNDDKGKRIHGLRADYEETEDWFPGNETNYYLECPYGAFPTAIQQASDSLSRIADTFSGGGFQMGSISQMWSIAEQRAVKRAADYIAKNKISLSFGGSPGANPQGLINGNGLDGFLGDIKMGLETAEAYYDSIHVGELAGATGSFFVDGGRALWNALPYTTVNIETALKEYQSAWKTRQQDLGRISNSLIFNIQLNHVSEQSLKAIERDMVEINTVIRQSIDQKSLPKICERLNMVIKTQCKNKALATPVSCKE
jgi:hypothetical protein